MDPSAILQGLNPAQRAAVTSDSKVVQILAPPGSGKTKTLTARVAYLLGHHGYKPANIICLTFTNKSAREMRDRIARLIGNGLQLQLVMGTFHSVCRRYIATYGHLIGIKKGFGIADADNSAAIIKRISKRMKATLEPKAISSRISRAKARRTSYVDLQQEAAGKKNQAEQQEFLQVFQEYESQLETSNLLDFDDLLLRCVDLLQLHPECVSNVEAVLIDEFQDTNSVQFELMRLFAAAHQRITTVGDPDQSIYGWRSAEIKNLAKMQRLYPDALVLNLEINYRSSEAILAAAKEVIEQDTARPWKPLRASHCHGTRPVLRQLPTSQDEARWIVSEVRRYMTLCGGQLLNYSDFAILLRTASLSRQIESAFGHAGMPYRMVGGARFFDRVEVKILLNYLRVVCSPNNSEAFTAIVNIPSRRIGDATIKSLVEEAQGKSLTVFELLRSMVQGASLTTKITKPAETAIGSLLNIILTAREKLAKEAQFYPSEVLSFIIRRLDYKGYLGKTYPEDVDARWANVEELAAQASDASFGLAEDDVEEQLPILDGVEQQTKLTAAEEALTKFLANIVLSNEKQTFDENDPDQPHHRITISTIHNAKGLEWPIVFVPGAFNGCIPHSRAEDTDEERRLLYVAMTRAQAMLAVCRPLRSSTTGDETEPSEFLCAKPVKSQFVQRGPSMRLALVHQIADILGREKPSEELVIAGQLEVPSLEDDLWGIDEEDEASMPNKKRRLEFGSVLARADAQSHGQATAATGFVSASSHMKKSGPAKEPVEAPRSKAKLQSTIHNLWNLSTTAQVDVQLPECSKPFVSSQFRPRVLQTSWETKATTSPRVVMPPNHPGPNLTVSATTAATMSAKREKGKCKWYAVRVGHVPGVYERWEECQAQIQGVRGAVFKSFSLLREAEDFVAGRDLYRPGEPPRPSSTYYSSRQGVDDAEPSSAWTTQDTRALEALGPASQHRVQISKFSRPTADKPAAASAYVFLSSSPPREEAAVLDVTSQNPPVLPLAKPSASVAPLNSNPATASRLETQRSQGTKRRSLGMRRHIPGLPNPGYRPFKPPRPVQGSAKIGLENG